MASRRQKSIPQNNNKSLHNVLIHRELVARGYIKKGDSLPLHNPPKTHIHSDALYHLDKHIIGDDMIFSSTIPPHSTTSEHYHPATPNHTIRELYVLLRGGLEVVVGGKVVCLNHKQRELIIEPGIIHQGRTNSRSALILIIMYNGALIPEDQLHIHTRNQPKVVV